MTEDDLEPGTIVRLTAGDWTGELAVVQDPPLVSRDARYAQGMPRLWIDAVSEDAMDGNPGEESPKIRYFSLNSFEPVAICPRCEVDIVLNRDYLCETCRYG